MRRELKNRKFPVGQSVKVLAGLAVGFGLIVFFSNPVAAQTEPDREVRPELAGPLKDCLISQFGAKVFEEISTETRAPTDSEIKQGEACFKKHGPVVSQSKGRPPKIAEAIRKCLISTLGAEFESLDRAITPEENRELNEKCFKDKGKTDRPSFSLELKNCLVQAVGRESFDLISTGARGPTRAEANLSRDCFERFGGLANPSRDRGPSLRTDIPNIPPEVDRCITGILGVERIAEFQGRPTPEQEKAIQASCFKDFKPLVASPTRPNLSSELKNCLVERIGQAAFDEISIGAKEPTQAQAEKGRACFEKFGGPSGDQATGEKSRPPGNLPPEIKACVQSVLGASFEDLNRRPTRSEEERLGAECFKDFEPVARSNLRQPNIELSDCLRKNLGGQTFETLKKGGAVAEGTEEKAKKCFEQFGGPLGAGIGQSSGPAGDLPKPSPEVEVCVERLLGAKLKDFKRQPNEEEKSKLNELCFKNRGPRPEAFESTKDQLVESETCLKGVLDSSLNRPIGKEDRRKLDQGCRIAPPPSGRGDDRQPSPGPGSPSQIGDCADQPEGLSPENSGSLFNDNRRKVNDRCKKFENQGPQNQPKDNRASPDRQPVNQDRRPALSGGVQAQPADKDRVEECGKKVLGSRFEAVKRGEQPKPEEIVSLNECFNQQP